MQIISRDTTWDELLSQSSVNELLHAVDSNSESERTAKGTQIPVIVLYGTEAKTKMAAAALIGNRLKKEVYKINVRVILSNNFQETKKNMDAVFAQGAHKNAILFFDEAEALFVNRTGVGDSHDRYVDVQLTYLLQKIEQYSSLVLLSTYSKEQVPPAYVKYFGAIVHLP